MSGTSLSSLASGGPAVSSSSNTRYPNPISPDYTEFTGVRSDPTPSVYDTFSGYVGTRREDDSTRCNTQLMEESGGYM
jgi:hypothetical protein